MAIVDASRNMELYEEETDTEVYKIGIHTLDEFTAARNARRDDGRALRRDQRAA